MFNSVTNFKRNFSRWSTLRTETGEGGGKVTTTKGPPPSSPSGPSPPPRPIDHSGNDPGNIKVAPGRWDKICLVWSGHYKNASEIPEKLDKMTIHKSRTWGRIRVNIYMLIITAVGCGYMIYSGKSAAKRGELSVTEKNLEWHRKIQEEYRKSQTNVDSTK